MNIDVKIAEAQRNQFAHSIVQLAVALGIVDRKQGYTGEQIAFLAETALEHVCKLNRQYDPEYAAKREALLKAMWMRVAPRRYLAAAARPTAIPITIPAMTT